MAYMVYQRVTSEIRETYAGRRDVADHAAAAEECRAWLESLEIDPVLRASLVEPIAALEEAFRSLSSSAATGPGLAVRAADPRPEAPPRGRAGG